MVSNLAGALALVTCKEPLRVSLTNHLRQLLTQSASDDPALIDQVATTCSADNLELGCLLIEKAATEKAMRDINDALELAVAMRAEHRDRNVEPFFDGSVFAAGARYPGALPPALRPKPQEGGLTPEQFSVYEAFQRAPRQPVAPSREQQAALAGSAGGGGASAPPAQQQPLSASQALDKYKQVVLALDVAVQKLLQQVRRSTRAVADADAAQPGFHDVPTSHLPPDHEVMQQLHLVRVIVASTAPEARAEVAVVLAQSVFKRLFDGSPTDKVRGWWRRPT
jgi:hypothetical protein